MVSTQRVCLWNIHNTERYMINSSEFTTLPVPSVYYIAYIINIVNAQCVSGTTYIEYIHTQNIGTPYNLIVIGIK